MEKRLLALTLAFVMALVTVPAAFAAETDITNTGSTIWTGQNGNDGPTPSGTYKAGNGTLEWDLASLTITLTDATIEATDAQYGNALEIIQPSGSYPEVTMVLHGTNTITGKDLGTTSGICSYVPLRISGSGTLTVTAGTASIGTSTGIKCFGLTVEGGAVVNAVGGTAGTYSYGVSSTGAVTVAGTLNATAGSGSTPIGMSVNGGIVVEEGGVLTARGSATKYKSYGIDLNGANMPMTINGTLVAVGFAPFGNQSAVYQNKVIIKGSESENGTDLYGFSTDPVSFSAAYLAENPKYIIITPDQKAPQDKLAITGQPTGTIRCNDTFRLGVSGGSGNGAVTWAVADGPAEVDPNGTVAVTGAGDVTIIATKAGDDIYAETAAACAFTAEKAIPSVGGVSCSTALHPDTDPESVTLSCSGSTEGTARLAAGTRFELGTREYDWIFTPADTANYAAATGKVSLTVTRTALETIAVTTQPDKKTYTAGETLDPAGMEVTATYADGTTAVVTGYQVQYAGGTAFKAGDTSVTLRYTEGGVTGTCSLGGLTVNKKSTGTVTGKEPGGREPSGGPESAPASTTKGPDGSTTTTSQDAATGTVTETTQRPDGSSVTKVTQKDGTSASVTTGVDGSVEMDVKLTAAAVSSALESGSAISLPLPQIQAAKNMEAAPIVTVHTGSKEAVKVEIPVKEPTPGTVAVIVKANGEEEVIKTSLPTEDGVAVALPDGAAVKLVDNSKRFSDVSEAHWADDAVAFVSARELLAGTSETDFSPQTPMTRGMWATALARLDGASTEGGDSWYKKGMSWAAENGISDGSAPNSGITREQMAAMLWRYAGSPAVSGQTMDFSDADRASGWARAALRWGTQNGVINGKGRGVLDPQGPATRAESAQMLKNFMEKIVP